MLRAFLVAGVVEGANEEDDDVIASLASSTEVRGVVAVEWDMLVKLEVIVLMLVLFPLRDEGRVRCAM